MCGGGGGGGGGAPQEAMPPVSQEQINAAISLPEGFRAAPVPISQGGGYAISDPSGAIVQRSETFGDLLAAGSNLNIVGSAAEGIYDPETRQFINRTTGQVLDPTTAGQVTGTLAGRQVAVGRPGEYRPGITDLAYGLMQQDFELPEQQVAGFVADQERAFELARQGVGSYRPFLERGEALTEEGVAALQAALGETRGLAGQIPGVIDPGRAALERAATGVEAAAERGITGADVAAERARASTAEAQRQLQEASAFGLESARAGIAGLAPGAAMGFMSPFEEAAVQQALADIGRQGQLAQQQVRGQAVQAGAFGGSRQAVAEQELQRNILEQQARTAAQLRAAGFESAANRAMQGAQLTGQLGQIGAGAAAGAAEAGGRLGLSAEQLAQASALQGGQLGLTGAQAAGNLGLQSSQLGLSGIQAGLGAQQQAAGLGQGIAGLGQQFVGLGQAGQQMNLQDVNTMLTTGMQQQRQEQAVLDAARANQMQTAMQPFQQLAFASDIITGAPSGQTAIMTQPGPSVGSQLFGLGVGGYALSRAAPSMFGGGA
jgi:hypothetical protein